MTSQVYAEAQRFPVSKAWAGSKCEAITRSGNCCAKQVVVVAAQSGPRADALLCKVHGASKYTVDVR